MKVVVIGSSYINYIFKDDKHNLGEQTIKEPILNSTELDYLLNLPEVSILGGGKGANQAYSAKRILNDHDITFISTVGDDKIATDLLNIYKDNNIPIENIIRIKNHITNGTYTIISNGTGRMYGTTAIRTMNLLTEDILTQDAKRKIIDADVIITHLEMSFSLFKYIMNVVRKYGKKIIVDPNPHEHLHFLKETIDDITYLTPNILEFESMCSEFNVSASEMVKKHKNIIRTMGNKGIKFNDIYIEPISVRQIDDIGAGDAFNGCLGALLPIEEITLIEKLKFANLVAAIKVTRDGAQSCPNLDEIKDFLNNSKIKNKEEYAIIIEKVGKYDKK